jgi:hypothetical protein
VSNAGCLAQLISVILIVAAVAAILYLVYLIIVYIVLPILGILIAIGILIPVTIAGIGLISGIAVGIKHFLTVFIAAHKELP